MPEVDSLNFVLSPPPSVIDSYCVLEL